MPLGFSTFLSYKCAYFLGNCRAYMNNMHIRECATLYLFKVWHTQLPILARDLVIVQINISRHQCWHGTTFSSSLPTGLEGRLDLFSLPHRYQAMVSFEANMHTKSARGIYLQGTPSPVNNKGKWNKQQGKSKKTPCPGFVSLYSDPANSCE